MQFAKSSAENCCKTRLKTDESSSYVFLLFFLNSFKLARRHKFHQSFKVKCMIGQSLQFAKKL